MLGTIHGRLVRSPELRTFKRNDGEEGTVCNFTVAADNRYGAKTDASFYQCSIFGKRAEAIEKFFDKGSEIVATGYLEQEEYTDKNGDTKRNWKFAVIDFDFCGKKADNESRSTKEPNTSGFGEVTDEDIPF